MIIMNLIKRLNLPNLATSYINKLLIDLNIQWVLEVKVMAKYNFDIHLAF